MSASDTDILLIKIRDFKNFNSDYFVLFDSISAFVQNKGHLQPFINAYNFGKRLKAWKGLTVFEFFNGCWNEEPDKFKTNPKRLFAGQYVRSARKSCVVRDYQLCSL